MRWIDLVATSFAITGCATAPRVSPPPPATPITKPADTRAPAAPDAAADHDDDDDDDDDHADAAAATPVVAPPAPVAGAPTYDDVRPFFAKHCDRCHGAAPEDAKIAAKARKHLDTATYPFGGHHGAHALEEIAKALRRDANGRTRMPADDRRGLGDDEIALVARWIAVGGPR